MPERDWRLRIHDMLGCIEKIERFTEGLDLTGFEQDERTVDAVLRNLEVLGEAAVRIPEHIKTDNPDIPWPQMRAIRNVVAHEYFGVNLPIIWETVTRRLPELKPALQALIGEHGSKI
jgi:uncharacterized protein with HEPN domain